MARTEASLQAAAESIRSGVPGAGVAASVADVSDAGGLGAAMDEVARAAGGIDLLVNSAGILREGYFETQSDGIFREVMDVDFFGVVAASRAALPHLKVSGGAIVNIASVAGLTGVFGYTAYCSAKHALVGFTNALRLELEPQGVRVQLVCPGEFDSPMVAGIAPSRTPENRVQARTIPKLSVDQVADETVAGIASGDRMIVPGAATRLLVAAQRIAPALGDAVSRRRIAAVYRGPASR